MAVCVIVRGDCSVGHRAAFVFIGKLFLFLFLFLSSFLFLHEFLFPSLMSLRLTNYTPTGKKLAR